MGIFPKFGLKKKSKLKLIDEKVLSKALDGRLSNYMTRNELKEFLSNLERDKRKKAIWDSLPKKKKIEYLRYLSKKRGLQDET